MNSLPLTDPALFEGALAYLKRHFSVTDQQAGILMTYCEVRSFGRKELIVKEGEVDQYLNLVLSGLVRKFVAKAKSDVTLQLATEGHIVHSEISFLTRTPSLVFLETLEPTTLLCLSYDKMQEGLEKMPGADRMGFDLLVAMFSKKDERHYRQLMQSTRERFLEYVNNHPHMLQRVPQKYLASYLNIKPETFSRLKHLLRQKKD